MATGPNDNFVANLEIWQFSHNKGKANFCLSDIHKISQTHHLVMSTITTKVLLTFDLGKKNLL